MELLRNFRRPNLQISVSSSYQIVGEWKIHSFPASDKANFQIALVFTWFQGKLVIRCPRSMGEKWNSDPVTPWITDKFSMEFSELMDSAVMSVWKMNKREKKKTEIDLIIWVYFAGETC